MLGCPEAASGRWLYELDVGLNATINLQFFKNIFSKDLINAIKYYYDFKDQIKKII